MKRKRKSPARKNRQPSVSVRAATYAALKRRSEAEGVTVAALIERMLDAAEVPTLPPTPEPLRPSLERQMLGSLLADEWGFS